MKIVFDLFSEYTNTPTDPQIQKHTYIYIHKYTNSQKYKFTYKKVLERSEIRSIFSV